MANQHHYTSEQIEFIKQNVAGRGNAELTELFNKHFNLELGVNQIKGFKKNHKLSSGLTGHFPKGNVPFNKGRKGISYEGMKATQFKKGHKPWNYKPVGSERVNGDDYVDIKIADPNKWKGKHILIWEAANGPVPKGYAIIFGDGNKRNFNLDNLLLVSRKQLVRLNQKNLISDDAELTKTGIIIADIFNRIGERKRSKKGR